MSALRIKRHSSRVRRTNVSSQFTAVFCFFIPADEDTCNLSQSLACLASVSQRLLSLFRLWQAFAALYLYAGRPSITLGCEGVTGWELQELQSCKSFQGRES